jgi:hypothetical protein
VHRTGVVDTALYDHVKTEVILVEVEETLPVVNLYQLDPRPDSELVNQQLLFHPQDGMQKTNFHLLGSVKSKKSQYYADMVRKISPPPLFIKEG